MALEHIIKHSCRFNIKNPQHKKVNEVLVNLSPDVCKSKSQFLIDAAEYYIDHFGKEAFMDVKKNKVEYVTREEFEALKAHIIDLAINAAKDEMIRIGYSLKEGSNVSAYVSNIREEPAKKVKEEDDEVIVDYALGYMPEGMEE